MHINKINEISYKQQGCLYLIYDAGEWNQMKQIA